MKDQEKTDVCKGIYLYVKCTQLNDMKKTTPKGVVFLTLLSQAQLWLNNVYSLLIRIFVIAH